MVLREPISDPYVSACNAAANALATSPSHMIVLVIVLVQGAHKAERCTISVKQGSLLGDFVSSEST